MVPLAIAALLSPRGLLGASTIGTSNSPPGLLIVLDLVQLYIATMSKIMPVRRLTISPNNFEVRQRLSISRDGQNPEKRRMDQ